MYIYMIYANAVHLNIFQVRKYHPDNRTKLHTSTSSFRRNLCSSFFYFFMLKNIAEEESKTTTFAVRETASLGQQMLNATVGKNELIWDPPTADRCRDFRQALYVMLRRKSNVGCSMDLIMCIRICDKPIIKCALHYNVFF